MLGTLLTVSMVHGGPAPGFLSPKLFDYIVGGMACNIPITLNDLENSEGQCVVQKVKIFCL
jgi:hypothetical protein